jgi:hypothetical protein
LAPGHKRRIFFNTPSSYEHYYGFGLGYEEVDENDLPVAGTFSDVAQFDPSIATICLPLAAGNSAANEVWELVNLSNSDHNFHIHQARFSVLSAPPVNDTAVPTDLRSQNTMADSLPLAHADGFCRTVSDWRNGLCTAHVATVRITFAIAGDFVYHCHVLSHEDSGMMAVIRVRSAAGASNSSVLRRMLSVVGLSSDDRKQPINRRIEGAMCRTPAVRP